MVSISESLVALPEDKDGLKSFFERFGFKTLLREVTQRDDEGAPRALLNSPEGELFPGAIIPVIKGDYETVVTEDALERWLALIDGAALTSVDTETTSLDPMTAQMVGISLSVEAGKGAYIPLAHRYAGVPEQLAREMVLERMRSWLEDPAKPKVGQNLKYDSHIFANHGVTLRGIAQAARHGQHGAASFGLHHDSVHRRLRQGRRPDLF